MKKKLTTILTLLALVAGVQFIMAPQSSLIGQTYRMLVRRGLAADLPTLAAGEFGFATDTRNLYIGSSVGNIRVHGDYITPEMYGAKGDGVTDDTAAIQAAIDYLEANSGGTILFSKDKVYIHTGLTITGSHISLAGAGPGTTELRNTGTGVGLFIWTGSGNVEFPEIRDMSVTGDGGDTTGIYLGACLNTKLSRLYVGGHGGIGIESEGCLYETFDTLSVRSNGSHGIKFSWISNANVLNNVDSTLNGGDGLFISSEHDSGVTGVSDGYGILGCAFQLNTGCGIRLAGAGKINIYGAWLEENTDDQLRCEINGVDRCSAVHFQGMIICGGSTADAIQITDTDYFTLEPSHVSGRFYIGAGCVAPEISSVGNAGAYNYDPWIVDDGSSNKRDKTFGKGLAADYTPPTAGTWLRGAIIWNNDPVLGGVVGWICTTGGTFSAATDNTGDTDGSTAVITGMTDTSDFNIGDVVSVSAGFPAISGAEPFHATELYVVSKTATTLMLNIASDSAESNVTVATPAPVLTPIVSLVDTDDGMTFDHIHFSVDGSGVSAYFPNGSSVRGATSNWGDVQYFDFPTVVFRDSAAAFATQLSLSHGVIHTNGLPIYANNAAALAGGLVAGDLYRTNGDPDTVCVVH